MIEGSQKRRFFFFLIITALFITLIVWKYGSIMLFGEKQAGTIPGKPMVERGPILDRNGRILAIQTAMDSVEAWIPYIREAQETAGLLAEILEMDEEELFTAFTTRSGSMWIKRKITPTEAARIRELQAQDRLPGIYLRQEFGRNYPEQRIAGHLIGYVGTDNVGLDGIEYALEDTLSPEPEGRHQDTLYGNQVFLTIDITIQHTAEKLAREALEEYQADSVMILVADAKNGDILASASAPDFNPNSFMDFSEKERKNLPVTFSYEPGSVFKIFSIASFLDTGSITPYTTFFCNGLYENPLLREPIACLGAHGSVDAEHILEYSCNAGAAYASDTISIEDFHMMITRFGFGKPTGLPLAGESHGLVRDPGQWSSRSKPTISFGQEILVSAMQIIQATTTFTNRGIMLRPHIIKKIVAPDGRVLEEYNREPIREVISAATADTVLNMMEAATGPAGTARRAAVEGYRMSAKTGTAEVLDPKTGTYSKEAFLASCLAILPTDDPALIVYVVIDYPKTGIYYGSRIAAPIVGAISSEILTYLGIPGEGYRVIEHPGMITLPAQQALTVGATLPDFTGFSKKDLLPLLEDHRFTLKIQGSGWVVRQYPPAGTTVTEGMTISVELQ